MGEKKYLPTPSQTVGPFFAYGLTPLQYGYDFKNTVGQHAATYPECGAVEISGRILDGEGAAIPDAMVELWRFDGERRILARSGTGDNPLCLFNFKTPKPGAVAGQAPFFTVIVFMRGQLIHSFTRLYFDDESELNDKDKVLNLVPRKRRHTLIAKTSPSGMGYIFDIRMQGKDETVFFDL